MLKRAKPIQRTAFKSRAQPLARGSSTLKAKASMKMTERVPEWKPSKRYRKRWIKSAATIEREKRLAKWSRDVRKRDNNICHRCGKKGQHAHHKALRSLRPDLAFELSNGVTLCSDCHTHVHLNWSESVADGWIVDEAYELRS